MDTINILGIFILLLLLIPVFIVNYKLDIKLNKSISISIVRMMLQLGLTGVYLKYLFEFDNSLLNLFYIFIMISIASYTTVRSASLGVRQFIVPIFISIFAPSIFVLIYFNSLVIGLDNIFTAQYMISIGGMLLGNVLNGNIVAINNFRNSIVNESATINYELSLGATKFQAVKPFIKQSLESAVKPMIASMATMGLVSLPGMMTGQILGGSMPVEAIMYQIAIMVAIFVVTYSCGFGSILWVSKIAFTEKDILKTEFLEVK